LDDVKHELFSYSLAKPGRSEDSLWIHPAVHTWSRKRLNKDKKKWKAQKAVILIGRLASSDEQTPDIQAIERRLMPHVQLCFKHICHSGYLDDIQTGPVRDVFGVIRWMAYALRINNQWVKNMFDMTKRLARVL
jgi:hypothetical protein